MSCGCKKKHEIPSAQQPVTIKLTENPPINVTNPIPIQQDADKIVEKLNQISSPQLN